VGIVRKVETCQVAGEVGVVDSQNEGVEGESGNTGEDKAVGGITHGNKVLTTNLVIVD
jgi:hypothetical protein